MTPPEKTQNPAAPDVGATASGGDAQIRKQQFRIERGGEVMRERLAVR
jgi:hypothetical protein